MCFAVQVDLEASLIFGGIYSWINLLGIVWINTGMSSRPIIPFQRKAILLATDVGVTQPLTESAKRDHHKKI